MVKFSLPFARAIVGNTDNDTVEKFIRAQYDSDYIPRGEGNWRYFD
jgi:hypothetical protein